MSLSLLVYRSRSTNQLKKDKVVAMSKHFADRNRHRDITGMLVFDGEFFLQVLEGPRQRVSALYELIQTDPRHDEVVTVLEEPIYRRTFDDWGLGFIVINDEGGKQIISSDLEFDDQLHRLGLDNLERVDATRASLIIDAFAKGRWRDSYNIPSRKLYDDLNGIVVRPNEKAVPIGNYPVNFAFQPIVNPISKLVTSAEALLRGPNSESPLSILSQYSGIDLYRFDLESKQYALQIAADMGLPCRISLNLLPMSLIMVPDAVDFLLDTIERLGLSSEQIVVEITEEEAITNYDAFFGAITRLRGAGIKVAIDDFGAGYAGLSLLAEFQPDKVKIDRKLIQGIQTNGPRQAIVRAIIECCYSLGISVIAEGVEEAAEVQWLLAAGVSKFQGFYFARPSLNSFPQINW
ncbi:diguanylate phosphodiesterase [Methylophaga sp. OBS1]|uniref:diguanylate phosphodiesterase n=1 Tax=Methylophaga sp. OBS1 TaxID=2991933 RepID=UPI0022521EF1|nr:diguanylate phosphodiesterase [Methylophaga sp. OBS1]MCX4191025.1 diguanylate phosphodiesterase [Methylophaga sp. OBS1]MCX4192029.1 diguanylate phosphodiesterase [Methylophaga sp. OBS1]